MKIYVGIDISKKDFAVSVKNNGNWSDKSFKNTTHGFKQVNIWLLNKTINADEYDGIHAVMEATGSYGDKLAKYLYDAGHVVSIVNPFSVKSFAQCMLMRSKTDKMDARLIAEYASKFEPAAWEPLSEELYELRGLVRYRTLRVKQRTQLKNRISSCITKADRKFAINDLDVMQISITTLEKEIKDFIKLYTSLQKRYKLLLSIPGIGSVAAAIIMVETPHLEKFQSPKHAAAYAGLTPKTNESGTSVRGRRRMCKTGNAALRRALYMAALSASQHNPRLIPMYQRLIAKGDKGAKMRALGAVMRKLIHIAYGVVKSGENFQATIHD